MLKILSVIFLIHVGFSSAPGKDCGKENEAIKMDMKDTDTSRYLCPPESESDMRKLEELTREYTAPLKYCLFDTKFESYEEKVCQSEPKPIFTLSESNANKPIKCGFKEKQYLHYFGYIDCGGQVELSQIRGIKSKKDMENYLTSSSGRVIKIYYVCFDIPKQETIYTRHRVTHLSFYQDRKFKDEPYCPDTISTDAFFMNTKDFLKIQQHYQDEKEKPFNDNFRILPQAMVPAEHFAVRSWKKTTNHFINRAPLWDYLDLIRTSVNQGIKKAALQIFSEKSDPNDNEELYIYTRTMTFNKTKFLNKLSNRIKRKHFFEPSIWYIFVYNEVKSQGLMIYIHNKPVNEEQPLEKKCTDDMVIKCDLRIWSDTANDPDYIYPVDLKYAYCCKVTSQQAKEIFSVDFKIEDALNIDDLVERFNSRVYKN